MFVLLFNAVRSYDLILTKNGLGYILGVFFTNSHLVTLLDRIFCQTRCLSQARKRLKLRSFSDKVGRPKKLPMSKNLASLWLPILALHILPCISKIVSNVLLKRHLSAFWYIIYIQNWPHFGHFNKDITYYPKSLSVTLLGHLGLKRMKLLPLSLLSPVCRDFWTRYREFLFEVRYVEWQNVEILNSAEFFPDENVELLLTWPSIIST
jgi:hypothetical protein